MLKENIISYKHHINGSRIFFSWQNRCFVSNDSIFSQHQEMKLSSKCGTNIRIERAIFKFFDLFRIIWPAEKINWIHPKRTGKSKYLQRSDCIVLLSFLYGWNYSSEIDQILRQIPDDMTVSLNSVLTIKPHWNVLSGVFLGPSWCRIAGRFCYN